MDKLYYAKITEAANGEESYEKPVQLAKAMSADLSVELAEATLYADDGAAEIVKEFKSGNNPGTYVFSNDGVAIYPVAAPAEETYRIHTVVKGDSLWDIAKKYLGNGTRYPEIKALNDLKSNVIYSGWKLKIPN